jgi:hypothetical protein
MISDDSKDLSEVISLTPVQIEMVLRADEAFRHGEKGLSPEEVMDRARYRFSDLRSLITN